MKMMEIYGNRKPKQKLNEVLPLAAAIAYAPEILGIALPAITAGARFILPKLPSLFGRAAAAGARAEAGAAAGAAEAGITKAATSGIGSSIEKVGRDSAIGSVAGSAISGVSNVVATAEQIVPNIIMTAIGAIPSIINAFNNQGNKEDAKKVISMSEQQTVECCENLLKDSGINPEQSKILAMKLTQEAFNKHEKYPSLVALTAAKATADQIKNSKKASNASV